MCQRNTEHQKINMAYICFQRCMVCKSVLTRWDKELPGQQTWEGFKKHFRLAHKALKRTCSLRIRDTISRDTVANMVSEEFQQCYLTTEADPQEPPTLLPVDTTEPTNETTPIVAQTTCSSTSDITIQTLQQQMMLMQALMTQM